jgi:uncharacterized protein (TIGR03435 family)
MPARFLSPKGWYMTTKGRLLWGIQVVVAVSGVAGVLAAGDEGPGLRETPPGPAFEVASIKPSPPSTDQHLVAISQFQPGGRFTATNVQLRSLIALAYDLVDAPILGGPAWITTDRFEIVAKAEASASIEQIRLMLQALLKERFKLAAHTDTRELPVYTLVIARGDGRLGPKLRAAAVGDCPEATGPGGRARARWIAPTEKQPSCGIRIGIGGKNLEAWGVTMAQLSNSLSTSLHQPVHDRTGLTGRFDLDLEWSEQRAARLPTDDAHGISSPDDGVSIFTAVKEQLGLKLEPANGPVEVLVIDSVEHPTEN